MVLVFIHVYYTASSATSNRAACWERGNYCVNYLVKPSCLREAGQFFFRIILERVCITFMMPSERALCSTTVSGYLLTSAIFILAVSGWSCSCFQAWAVQRVLNTLFRAVWKWEWWKHSACVSQGRPPARSSISKPLWCKCAILKVCCFLAGSSCNWMK